MLAATKKERPNSPALGNGDCLTPLILKFTWQHPQRRSFSRKTTLKYKSSSKNAIGLESWERLFSGKKNWDSSNFVLPDELRNFRCGFQLFRGKIPGMIFDFHADLEHLFGSHHARVFAESLADIRNYRGDIL